MLDEAVGRGFRFVGGYLQTLTPERRDAIFGRGLGILPYTEAMTGEVLTAATGRAYGQRACELAADLGVPELVHIGIDLELPMPGSDVTSHLNSMSGVLGSQRRGAALYVGVPQPLTSEQLFKPLRPNRYIKGGGRVVDAAGELAEPACGWAALQLEPLEAMTLAGVAVDVEVTKFDYEGRALILWWP